MSSPHESPPLRDREAVCSAETAANHSRSVRTTTRQLEQSAGAGSTGQCNSGQPIGWSSVSERLNLETLSCRLTLRSLRKGQRVESLQ